MPTLASADALFQGSPKISTNPRCGEILDDPLKRKTLETTVLGGRFREWQLQP